MYRITALCCVVLTVACAPAEEEMNETAAADAAPIGISLADVAGAWTVQSMPTGQDTVLVTYVLSATAETDGWTLTLPGREPMPIRVVAVDGDSIVTEMGPFESALRAGVTVTAVRSVVRLKNGMLVGTFTTVYETGGPDSVLTGRMHGMRGQ